EPGPCGEDPCAAMSSWPVLRALPPSGPLLDRGEDFVGLAMLGVEAHALLCQRPGRLATVLGAGLLPAFQMRPGEQRHRLERPGGKRRRLVQLAYRKLQAAVLEQVAPAREVI